mmetsp:Transcript_2160/g.4207  ORF Transcript_2160/g.4207 Transcript_2160/m.4207 type:complete len:322 (+) Transcript_2160:64-1029(+)
MRPDSQRVLRIVGTLISSWSLSGHGEGLETRCAAHTTPSAESEAVGTQSAQTGRSFYTQMLVQLNSEKLKVVGAGLFNQNADTVPLTLFQSDKDPPNASLVAKWKKANPGLEYVFMDDDAGRAYLAERWSEKHAAAFDSINIGALRSDFLRLCYMADRGGFYADSDLCPAQVSLAELRSTCSDSKLFVPLTTGFGSEPAVWNAFFGAVPRHPALLRLVDQALDCIERRCGSDGTLDGAMWISGPVRMAPLLMEAHSTILHIDAKTTSEALAMHKAPGGVSAWLLGAGHRWIGPVVEQCPGSEARLKYSGYWQNMISAGVYK